MILIDSSVLVAYASKDDKFHQQSVSLLKSIEQQGASVNQHVVAETASVMRKANGHQKAFEVTKALLDTFQVIEITVQEFQEAVTEWTRSPSLSLVDATLVTASKHGAIIATFDQNIRKLAKRTLP